MTQLNITREALRKPNQKRRKSCPFAAPNTPEIDYKDLKVLTVTKFAESSGPPLTLFTLSIVQRIIFPSSIFFL